LLTEDDRRRLKSAYEDFALDVGRSVDALLVRRALLSMLRKDLPPDEYERFVNSLRLYRSRQATSTTDSQPSSES